MSAAGTKRRPFPWVGTGAPAHYIPVSNIPVSNIPVSNITISNITVSSIPVQKSARAADSVGTARDSKANLHSSEDASRAPSHEGLGFAVTVLAIVLAAVI